MNRNIFATLPALALMLISFPASSAFSAPTVSVDELYARYPENVEQVEEAITANSDYITYSSQAWDAMVDAETAEKVAVIAEQRHAEAEAEAVEAEKEAAAAQKESELASQEAYAAYRAQRHSVAGGALPPTVTAMVMGADSFDEYQRSVRNLEQFNERASMTAEEATEAKLRADRKREEADNAAHEAQVALQTAQEARAEADTKRKESEALLTAASVKNNQAEIALTTLDITAEQENAGPQLVMKTNATIWWDENRETEPAKPRGEAAVEQKIAEIEQVAEESVNNERREENQAASRSDKSAPSPKETSTPEQDESPLPTPEAKIDEAGVARTERAVSLLGTPYAEMTCSAFVSSFYGPEVKSLAELSVAGQRYPLGEAVPGDIVFYEADDGGLGQAGVYMGGGMAVVSSAPVGVLTVETAATGSYVVRPDEPPSEVYELPDESERWECGGIPGREINVDATWTLPFHEYEITAKYDEGSQTGMEFTRKGSDDGVYAPKGGIVTVHEDGTIQIAADGVTIKMTGIPVDKITARTGARIETGAGLGISDKVTVIAEIDGKSFNPEIFFFPSYGTANMVDVSGENVFNRGKYSGVPDMINPAVLPVDLSKVHISSGWGPRIPPVAGSEPFHRGLDFAGPVGTPIFSALDGVVWATYSDGASGNQIIVQSRVNGNDYALVYKHLSSDPTKYVKEGDVVTAGTVIGEMGSTGKFSTGSHLHFEVWSGVFNRDHHVDPTQFLKMVGAM